MAGKSFTDMYTGKKYRVIKTFKNPVSMNKFLDDKDKLKILKKKHGGGKLRYDMLPRELSIEVKPKPKVTKTNKKRRSGSGKRSKR